MSSELLIDAQALSKCYHIYERPSQRLWQLLLRNRRRFYREFWALKQVSLQIRRGETVGIIGRNGSGKSTLLQLLCGTLTATAGSVKRQGRVAALLELGSGFNPEFTGRENVYLNAAVLGLSRAQIDARYEEICAFANIGDFIDQPTKTYSSGMLVRLAFAVSVCVEPDILIVDEALSVGDASFQFKCLDRLETLTLNGSTLLFVSHDMAMVRRFCQRVYYLRDGQVVASGPAEEMAELYLLDMRDEQRRWASGGATTVARKPYLDGRAGMAFGTDEGHISAAFFTATGQLACTYRHDDDIEIQVHARLRAGIARPNVSLTIQEARLLVIGGANFALRQGPVEDGWYTASITVRFAARLGPGHYHVTLKLMEGVSEETSHLIEKQVGLLAFTVLPNERNFLGVVDLGLERVSDAAAQPPACNEAPTAVDHQETRRDTMLNVERIRTAELNSQPFAWAQIDQLFAPHDAQALAQTYPRDHFKTVSGYGGEKDYLYEARALKPMGSDAIAHAEHLSDAWLRLARDLGSPAYRAALSHLTGRDLSTAPMEVNVFHYGPGSSLGAHPDLSDKVVTHILYFNETWNRADGGCLTILHANDVDAVSAVIEPRVGNSAVLVRSDDSWHAVSPVINGCDHSRRSVTVTFYRPGSLSSMWPENDTTPLHEYAHG